MVVIVVTAWSKYRTTTSILMVLKEWNKYRNLYILKKIAWCKYRHAYHGGYVNNQNLRLQIHLVASSNQFLSKNKRACWEWNLICMPCSTGYNETIHVQKEKNIPLPCSNGGSFRSKKASPSSSSCSARWNSVLPSPSSCSATWNRWCRWDPTVGCHRAHRNNKTKWN